jgi:hypothetical protein
MGDRLRRAVVLEVHRAADPQDVAPCSLAGVDPQAAQGVAAGADHVGEHQGPVEDLAAEDQRDAGVLTDYPQRLAVGDHVVGAHPRIVDAHRPPLRLL